jgi:hypothetical protein
MMERNENDMSKGRARARLTSLARVSLGFGTLCEIDSNSNSDSLAVLD